VARLVLGDGETLVARSCGGGGYGPPWERDPETVRQSVEDGWISAGRAESVYGVVLDAAGAVNVQETNAARERLASGTHTVTAR
jgi:N-methylhydantoinase B